MSLLMFHSRDIDGAKFKVGDVVCITFKDENKQRQLQPPKQSIVTAVNQIETNVFEYGVDNFFFLLWEDELTHIKQEQTNDISIQDR